MSNTVILGADLDALVERWWVPVVRGIIAIVFGVLALVAPSIGLVALVVTWGVYAIADGVLNLVLAVRAAKGGGRVGWYLCEGIVGIAAGVLTFVYPGVTALVLLFMIAGWAVLTGIIEIIAAIELRKFVRGEWMLAVAGVLSIAFGGLLVALPRVGALAVVWQIATYAIVFGALLCGLGAKLLRMRRIARRFPTHGTAEVV